MAAGTLTGVEGLVTVGDGPTINISAFDLDIVRAIHDDSHFDGGEDIGGSVIVHNAKTKVGGMVRATGTCQGWVRQGTTPGLGTMQTEHEVTGGSFILLTESGTSTNASYTFEGILGSITVNHVKIDLVAVSFSFRSQGAVTSVPYADA